MDLSSARSKFSTETAPQLLGSMGKADAKRWDGNGSARFAYFRNDEDFIVLCGEQEGADADRALAYGLSYLPNGCRLVLVLPKGAAFSTQQRAAWLREPHRPTVLVHDGHTVESAGRRSRAETVQALAERLDGDGGLAEELRRATAPVHLGGDDEELAGFVERVSRDRELDPAHRRGERSWHYRGQRVLSIRRMKEGLVVRAGIHSSEPGSGFSVKLAPGHPFTSAMEREVWDHVRTGIEARRVGQYKHPDEHWLQAIIRRRPELVGVEQPALREVPAWRPTATEKHWSRGYIDLLGLDGVGDVRIVETKLSENSDEMLVLQGLDYYIWAQAYADVLRERLGAPKKAELVVHYVIGARPDGAVHVSPHARRHADLIDIPWRFQVISSWFDPDASRAVEAKLLPEGQVP